MERKKEGEGINENFKKKIMKRNIRIKDVKGGKMREGGEKKSTQNREREGGREMHL
jgi:hypothetical protein